MDLSDVSNKILGRMLAYLTFSEVSQLRGLSRNINCVARQILNTAFLDLGPRLATQYTAHLIHIKNTRPLKDPEHVAFKGRLLKLLSSEHSILLALCRHYVTEGSGCFSAGEILDLFYNLQGYEKIDESPNEENNKVAKLILLIDQYLDWFERYRMINEKRCSWFGACIVDILDSYLSSRYHLVASHNGSSIRLVGQYTINGYAETPPEIGNPLGCQISQYELLQVLRYLRKHARWHNFVVAFQDCDRTDLEDEQEKIFTKHTSSGYDIVYKKRPYGTIDSLDNVVSVRAIISLQCHRSLAPVRSCNRCFLKNYIFDDNENVIERASNESMNEDSRNLHKIVENSCSPLRLISSETTSIGQSRRNEEMYTFALELRSVHPKKWTGSNHGVGEKFGETTLNVNHTLDNIFAAKSEFRLY